jgi:hypothetical protein
VARKVFGGSLQAAQSAVPVASQRVGLEPLGTPIA